MKKILSEKILVVVLFVIVMVVFSLAQEDTKVIEKMHEQAVSVSSPVDSPIELHTPDAVTAVVTQQTRTPSELKR